VEKFFAGGGGVPAGVVGDVVPEIGCNCDEFCGMAKLVPDGGDAEPDDDGGDDDIFVIILYIDYINFLNSI
jgi:hypothetical protein